MLVSTWADGIMLLADDIIVAIERRSRFAVSGELQQFPLVGFPYCRFLLQLDNIDLAHYLSSPPLRNGDVQLPSSVLSVLHYALSSIAVT